MGGTPKTVSTYKLSKVLREKYAPKLLHYEENHTVQNHDRYNVHNT